VLSLMHQQQPRPVKMRTIVVVVWTTQQYCYHRLQPCCKCQVPGMEPLCWLMMNNAPPSRKNLVIPVICLAFVLLVSKYWILLGDSVQDLFGKLQFYVDTAYNSMMAHIQDYKTSSPVLQAMKDNHLDLSIKQQLKLAE
jgi:hypothetical protein